MIQFKSMKTLLLAGVISTMTMTTTYAQTVNEIADKHIKAVGGEAAWKKIKSVKTNMKISNPQYDLDIVSTMILGKKGHQTISVMGNEMSMGLTPEYAWQSDGKEVSVTSNADTMNMLKEQMQNLEFNDEFIEAKDKKFAMTLLGKEDVDGKPAYKVEVTDADGDKHTYYVDATTYYTVKQTEMANQMGQEMEVTRTFSDFEKTPEGIVVARTIDLGMAGKLKINSIEINGVKDESIFEKPKK